MDQRDETTWIAVELSHLGEAKVEDGTLLETLRSDLGVGPEFKFFIPATTYRKGQRTVTLHLMEGYVFIASGLPETSYFSLERKPYVAQVMSIPSGPHRVRALSVVSNAQIEELKRQLQQMVSLDIGEGDFVRVMNGTYRGLEGTVLGVWENCAIIQFKLRSLDQIASIPLAFLETIYTPA